MDDNEYEIYEFPEATAQVSPFGRYAVAIRNASFNFWFIGTMQSRLDFARSKQLSHVCDSYTFNIRNIFNVEFGGPNNHRVNYANYPSGTRFGGGHASHFDSFGIRLAAYNETTDSVMRRIQPERVKYINNDSAVPIYKKERKVNNASNNVQHSRRTNAGKQNQSNHRAGKSNRQKRF